MTFSSLIRQLSTEPHIRGRQFERLCRWYLENAPEYRHRLKGVWLWGEWPGRWGPDVGIDLVAETVEGDLWAVQAKAEEKISKREIDSFLSESSRPEFAYRLLIATTDNLSANAYRTLVGQEKPVGLALRSHLEMTDLDWPLNLEALIPSRRSPVERRQHQHEAIRDILACFDTSDRGQLIMACGTGKTLVALWAAEDLDSQSTLVLVPSLTLLSQTLREWTANASKPFDYLAVCSDETVAEHDALVSHTTDLGLPVTTDSAAIRSFLGKDGRQVVFATYQSSRRIAEACARGAPAFDLAIADEAHRCTGPTTSDFTTILDEDQIRARRRLFMTATPRHFADRVRKAASEGDFEIASMDDEQRFGAVFHRLTFGEAISRGLLSDYEVLVVGVDEDTYQRYVALGEFVTPDGQRVTDARSLASHIGLAKAMKRYDLRRVITFHGRVKKAQSFSSFFPWVVDWMPEHERPAGKVWSRHVSGEMPTGRRNVLLGQFRQVEPGSRALLSNARCLAEGVDVPAIDGVAFIDPRGSQIAVIQAVGRAIRQSPDKTVSVVIIPVFVTDDQDAQKALEDSSFKPVWDVLKALRAHDEALGEQLDALRTRLGRDKSLTISKPEKIKLDLPTRVGEQFAQAFNVRIVEQTTTSWDGMVGLLRAYADEFGHSNVPGNSSEPWADLAQWVNLVRGRRRSGYLPKDRVEQLNEIGFGWRVEGQTIDDTTGLLNEREFRQASGLSRIARYRKKGLIEPVGYGMSVSGLSAFYHPKQVQELKDKLGITLDDTTGLLVEDEFRKNCRLTNVASYRKKGLIKPVGYALTHGSNLSAFYHPEQVQELKDKLGITLNDTTGLLNEAQFSKASGLSKVAWYRKEGLVKPVGYAIASGSVSPHYSPDQVQELRDKLGITLDDTTGLLSEDQFRKASRFTQIARYRKKGLIEPVGYGMSASHISAFYDPKQIQELKEKLGITLDDTTGLLVEKQMCKVSGLSRIAQYRKKGLIEPVGHAMAGPRVGAYYRPEQIQELKEKLGITLDDTTGLLNEDQFRQASGLSRIARYRKKGLIEPVGYGMSVSNLSAFYRPEQVQELRDKLGITLDDTTGLLNEFQFRKASGLSQIAQYRKKGLIEPVGYAIAGPNVSPHYRPEQIQELKEKLRTKR